MLSSCSHIFTEFCLRPSIYDGAQYVDCNALSSVKRSVAMSVGSFKLQYLQRKRFEGVVKTFCTNSSLSAGDLAASTD